MSESEADTFEIDVGDGEILDKDSTVAHIEYGPLTVSKITVSALGKKAEFRIEAAPEEMKIAFSGDDIRDMWGEEMHEDPITLREAREDGE